VPKSLLSNQARIILTVALLLALTAVAAGPFLTRPGLPRDTDAELHVFRAAQLGEALHGGAGYVRWAPDLWYGYGYPIFNYYSPLTYYLANLFVLFGLDVVNAVKTVFVLGLLGAAAGMYVFVWRTWGERAGIIAAAAYVFSPYVLFIDPHMRGDLPSSLRWRSCHGCCGRSRLKVSNTCTAHRGPLAPRRRKCLKHLHCPQGAFGSAQAQVSRISSGPSASCCGPLSS
jgi:hypothetical protein